MYTDEMHNNLLKKMPTVRAEFFFICAEYESDICLDSITQALAVTPTKARKKSDFPPGVQKSKRARDTWSVTISGIKSHDINIQVEELLGLLEGKEDIIKYLAQILRMKVGLNIYIHTNKQEGYPKLLFSKRLIEFAAAIGALISIDDYRY